MFTEFFPELADFVHTCRLEHESFYYGGSALISVHETQRARFRETMAYVRSQSPFYAKHLRDLPTDLTPGGPGWTRVPFTTKDNLRAAGDDILSKPIDEAWIYY